MSPTLYYWILGYFIFINLITLIVFAIDKISSRSNAWRVRERTLLLLALFGGSLGALFSMHHFRHKTKKGSFLIVFALILLIQLSIVLFLYARQPATDGVFNVGEPVSFQ